ncbi:hypothetical protein SASPL_117972 [Salvia splendens]|uniref:Cytochrome P450, family 72, subfamily C, polypeptide 1 n=1 Tax=Salvia splendens TaxID=180675 RepID=A0A8X8XWU4_SALSN|nr:cytochrome P450 CYP72A219-like isoform X2 [Salvia splendens]KAG6421420.1 hypothetical protein SASPL_117972 [Salvia splendens]
MDVKLGSIFSSTLILVCMLLAIKLLKWAWLRPRKLEKLLREQGLSGNPYRLLIGDMKQLITVMKEEQPRTVNLSDPILPHILPFYTQIIQKYGPRSFAWFGAAPRINISDPELMKEILAKPSVFQKPRPDPIGETIVGGLLFLEDAQWVLHRKIINAAFHVEKLKKMIPAMYACCSEMIEKWGALVSRNGKHVEMDVWPYLEDLSGDMISRTAFGCSHEQGRRIFQLQKEQVKLVLQLLKFSFIPGWRYFPTKTNRRMRGVSREIEAAVRGIIVERERAAERGETIHDDLLGILMESNMNEIQEQGSKKMGMSIADVIEECKLFYFAGSETTSNLLVWTLVMLSKHPDWQARARGEILQVLGMNPPTFDALNQLKTVSMILQEVLRIYPPAPLIIRAPTKTVRLGSMTVPVGAELTLLIAQMHHDPEIWGEDVNEFRPERFANGISSAAKMNFAFLPFSSGPRVCIGQNFAMMEAKMALAMMLRSFHFELSSSYLHAPFPILTLQPQYGAPLILRTL